MNVKPMLVRLEGAMDRSDLIKEMLLLPEPATATWATSTNSVNLVVGYNGSPSSQTALDLTMWIAHQTRLVTQKLVTVQVVYVVGNQQSRKSSDVFDSVKSGRSSIHQYAAKLDSASASGKSTTSVLTKPRPQALEAQKRRSVRKGNSQIGSQSQSFKQAARIFEQARYLAEEWRGFFKTHLRFGDVATELRSVVESEAATLLFVGCNSVEHPLIQRLGSNFPCSVLGIPSDLTSE